ncbi:Ltp family lipoprotein [Streptococcus sp. 10F2]
MKKIALLGVTLLASFTLVACSNNQSTESSSSSESQAEQSSSSSASTNNVDVNAAVKNLEYLKDVPMSKKALIEAMTSSEFEYSKEVAEEAIKQAGIDFKENAYKTAKQLNEFGMSADKIKESLTSEGDGGGYTESEVNYAIEKLEKELAEEK